MGVGARRYSASASDTSIELTSVAPPDKTTGCVGVVPWRAIHLKTMAIKHYGGMM